MFEATKRGNALEDLAFTDALTGLGNRRAWEAWLDAALGAAARPTARRCASPSSTSTTSRPTTTPTAIRRATPCWPARREAWRRELRPTDILARYGGEEFAAVLPACALADAHVVVERVRAATPLGQTVSAGIAEWDRAEDAEALVARADAALYAAKAAGRDRALRPPPRHVRSSRRRGYRGRPRGNVSP